MKLLTGAAVIRGLDWGWKIKCKEALVIWLLAGGLSSSPHRLLQRASGEAQNIAAGFPAEKAIQERISMAKMEASAPSIT